MSDHVVSHYKNVYALIGLSMGGFVAQDIMSRHPNYAEKVILMGTYCHGHDEATKAFYKGLIDKVQAGNFEEVITLFANVVVSKKRTQDLNLLKKISELPRLLGQEKCINHHKACMSWKGQEEGIKNINAQVLILAGEQEQAVPIEHHETLHKLIPNSQLKIITNVGHLMTLEEPETVNKIIIEFIS